MDIENQLFRANIFYSNKHKWHVFEFTSSSRGRYVAEHEYYIM